MSPEAGQRLSASAKLAMSVRVVFLTVWLLPAALMALVFARRSRD